MHLTVAKRDSDGNAYCYADSYGNGNGYGDCYSYSYSDGYTDGNCDGDAAAYSNAASTSNHAAAASITVTETIKRELARYTREFSVCTWVGCSKEHAGIES